MVLPCHERRPKCHVDLKNEWKCDWNGCNHDGESIQNNLRFIVLEASVGDPLHEENRHHESETDRNKNLDHHHDFRLEDGNNSYRFVLKDTLLSFPDLRASASIHDLTVPFSSENSSSTQNDVAIVAAGVLACKTVSVRLNE